MSRSSFQTARLGARSSATSRFASADERVHSDPAPWVRVTNLGDSSVDLTTRLWCAAGDYWELRFALIKKVKEHFDAEGISIPYPHSVEIQRKA